MKRTTKMTTHKMRKMVKTRREAEMMIPRMRMIKARIKIKNPLKTRTHTQTRSVGLYLAVAGDMKVLQTATTMMQGGAAITGEGGGEGGAARRTTDEDVAVVAHHHLEGGDPHPLVQIVVAGVEAAPVIITEAAEDSALHHLALVTEVAVRAPPRLREDAMTEGGAEEAGAIREGRCHHP
mmetsp:Transcript_36689/g.61908  ORF Transcript_36689/g.61908 Transcript_36689/m.61908 type:complete len:180 (+) Transcript_36689:246-785(+)